MVQELREIDFYTWIADFDLADYFLGAFDSWHIHTLECDACAETAMSNTSIAQFMTFLKSSQPHEIGLVCLGFSRIVELFEKAHQVEEVAVEKFSEEDREMIQQVITDFMAGIGYKRIGTHERTRTEQ